MRPQILTLLSALILSFSFSSCSKTNSSPSTTPSPVVGTMNINVSYPAQGPQFELIISEPGGTVLLDTLAPTNTPIIAALKTNSTVVDLTTVLSQGGNFFSVNTFKSINASTLTGLTPGSYFIKTKLGTTTPSSLFYNNIPSGVISGFNSFVFTNYPDNSATGSQASSTNNTIALNYLNYTGNYAYMILPSVGLYNLHMQTNAIDTVDCSHLDTAIALTFNRPSPFTVSSLYSSFLGIPDTTDLTKIMAFTSLYTATNRPGVDLQYPNVPVQKYELNVNATNASNDVVDYYCYTNTIPLTLPFPAETDYSLSSTTNDNFSVSFPNTAPTYYAAFLSSANILMAIYAPSDTSTIHPVTLLTNQKSKLLQGVSLSTLAVKTFEFENITGMNYAAFLSYITNPAAIQAKRISSAANLIKTLP
jgi:hypothetical protein